MSKCIDQYADVLQKADIDIARLEKMESEIGLDAAIEQLLGDTLAEQETISNKIEEAGGLLPTTTGSILGVEVEEITDEQEIQRIQQEYQRHLQAAGPEREASYDALTNLGGRPTAQGWSTATRISGKDGQPYVVHRGATKPLTEKDFFEERLGKVSQHPSAGLGVWFSNNRTDAATYGDVEQFYLDIRNPKVIKVEELQAFESVQDSIIFREKLRAAGHDGIAIEARHLGGPVHMIAFDADQVITIKAPAELYQELPTETVAFKEWFGDSKVVDESGEPQVVYHGTAEEFEAFDPERAIGGQHWFTTNKEAIEEGEVGAAGRGVIVEAYLSLQNPAGWKEYDNLTLDELIARGYDGLALTEKDETTYVAFEPTQIKSVYAERFDPLDPRILAQEKRGKIGLPGDITQAPSIISLLENADLSTFLHESGHFFFEVMRDMAQQPNASQALIDDMTALSQFTGVETLEELSAMSLEQRRAGHEKVAEAFEVYLFEGKAPSQDLQPLFQTFRAWLVNAYRQMRQYLAADKITDEVRGVFDRMLATDEAITYAERARGFTSLFESQEQSGATDEQWARYQTNLSMAHENAIEEVQSRGIKDMQWLAGAKSRELKKLQGKASQLRKAAKEEATKQAEEMPVYRARHLLKYGKFPDVEAEARPVKLNTNDLKGMYDNREDWIKLSHENMTSPEGVNPDDLALPLGYTSGDALVRALTSAPNFKQVVSDITDQIMLERHGEISNPAALQEAADEAVHNKARAKVIATEAKFLSKLAKKRAPDTKIAEAAAERLLGGMQIKDIKPGQFDTEERKASRAVQQAWKEGDHEKAARQSQRQLLNFHLAKMAREIKDQTEKDVRYVKKFDKAGVRKNIDIDQLDQIDDLRQGFDFTQTTLRDIAKRQSLQEWIDKQEEAGFEPVIDVAQMEMVKRKHYKTLTVDEMRGLVDSIKNIEHVGRLKKKLLTAKDKRDFAQRMDEARESIQANANRRITERPTPTDVAGRALDFLKGFAANHRKVASIIREMDASKDGGAMWELYIMPMNEAGDKETEMRADAARDMAELFKPIFKKISAGGLPGNLYAQKRVVPGTIISMTYEQRIMFGMNWGNLGNRQRLLDGGLSGKREMSEADAQAILNSLDRQDWGFIQATWDYIAEFKPQIAEQERRLTGVTPEWVEPSPVETKYGVYRGGYFPAKYDVRLSTRSEQDEAVTNLRQSMKGAFNAAATRKGYAQKRATEVKNRPMLLSFNAITQHVDEVTHRLAWQEWLTDTNRILKSLDNEIREYYGPEILKELRDAQKDIASGESRSTTELERLINHVRIGTTIQGMGFRLTTAAIQPTGLAQSTYRIGGKWMQRGLTKHIANPLKSAREIHEKSTMMRHRAKTFQREVNEVLNIARAGERLTTAKASYFMLIYKMQQQVDLPTWWGAHEKALEQLHVENAINQTERDKVEKKAIAMADQAVIDSQGGGQLKDLARVQRGGPLAKLWTNFYSYFNTTYNLNIEAFRKTNYKSPEKIAKLAVDLFMLNVVPVVIAVAIRQAMTGECGVDDPECWANKLAKEQSSFLFGQMIGLRELGSISDYFITGKGYGYQGPPGIRVIGETYKFGQQAAQGEADAAFWRSASALTGILFHLPMGQIHDTAEGLIAISEGETEGPVEATQALMTGK